MSSSTGEVQKDMGFGTFFCESAFPYWDSSLYSSAQKSPLSPLASCTALSSQLLALSTCSHVYGLKTLLQQHQPMSHILKIAFYGNMQTAIAI